MPKSSRAASDPACHDASRRSPDAGDGRVRDRSGNGKESGGTGLLVAVLLAGFALVALLAAQAYTTAVYHRTTAERALRDYATLAAEELVRRSTSSLGFNGYYPLIGTLRAVAGDGTAVPDRDAVASRLAGGDRRPLELARSLLRFDGATGVLATSAPLAPPAEAWIREALAARTTPGGGREGAFTALSGDAGGEPVRIVVGRSEGRPGFVGFEVDPRALGPWIAQTLVSGPLLPGSLTAGEVGNDALCLAVVDSAGRELLRSGTGCPPELTVAVPFGRAYEGVLDGLTARVAVVPEAARRLVIGGLPRSRLPILAVQLAIAAILAAAGLVLLRREQAVARLRSDFVSRVSHELRTPLTQIRLFAETLLLGRVRSQEEARRALVVIDQEARRLSHLVENVLCFARSERGELRLVAEERMLAPLVAETLEAFGPIAEASQVKVSPRLDSTVRARVDDGALRQVLLNLLDNAVKYGPRGQAVDVVLEPSPDGGARLTVEDGGRGVPAAERERIFRPYARLDRERASAVAGTGIGLSVVRELATAHGGRAWVEAAATGGARFVVELPGDAS